LERRVVANGAGTDLVRVALVVAALVVDVGPALSIVLSRRTAILEEAKSELVSVAEISLVPLPSRVEGESFSVVDGTSHFVYGVLNRIRWQIQCLGDS